MERAVVNSSLLRESIQPKDMLYRYLDMLEEDIGNYFKSENMLEVSCPVLGEYSKRQTFRKMGMQFHVSGTLGNVYISPRPAIELLTQFYKESPARKFWLTELMPRTETPRYSKVIHPQLNWVQRLISQYHRGKKLSIAEYFPNHWGYYYGAETVFSEVDYKLVTPLFDIGLVDGNSLQADCVEVLEEGSVDVVLLFEAIERAQDPVRLLQDVSKVLKPGGMCFILCLLASGLEFQILKSSSEIFVPPERMNLLSFEGMNQLIDRQGGFEIIEFSTPGVFDIPNIQEKLMDDSGSGFFNYILKERRDPDLIKSFQEFLQLNRLGTFGRLFLRKQ